MRSCVIGDCHGTLDIDLQVDLETHQGFLGGLQQNKTTGITAPYYASFCYEVVFHVSTRIPCTGNDWHIKVRHSLVRCCRQMGLCCCSKSLIFMCIPNLVMLVLLCVGVIIVPLYRHSQPEHIPIDDLEI